MPPYPDETLPISALSIQAFVDTCKAFILAVDNAEDPEHAIFQFVKFAIGGRHLVDEELRRVQVTPPPVLSMMARDVIHKTYYTTLYGWSHNLPFKTSWTMCPMMDPNHKIDKLQGLSVRINHIVSTWSVDAHGVDNGD